MKTPEDEAFDDIARKQGAWGGGFPAKRQMAADKLHWSDCAVHNGPAYPAGPCDCGVAQEPSFWLNEQGQLSATRGFAERHSIGQKIIPLYTTPPKREWVGLTDDEVYKIAFSLQGEHWRKVADAIEAKLKEKNFE